MANRAGQRRYVADVQKHNGTVRAGEQTFGTDPDWPTILPNLPVSFQDVGGGETVRGRQMEANTTGLVTAAWSPAVRAITPAMRLVIEGRKLEIVNVMDLDGKNREITMQVAETK